ncbi:MAG: hypothetical protein ACE5H7_13095 [Acidiferrobacterales bacterium]
MSQAFYLFTVSLGLAAILAAISIWSPRALWLKIGALVVAALFLPATYFSLVELLSRPKPVVLEWTQRDLSEADVIGADLREGKSIYLWLKVDGLEEPRSYVLAWDQKLAEQLHGARREAEAKGTGVRVSRPFMSKQEKGHLVFYAAPQPARPPKLAPAGTGFVFQPSARR